MNTIRIERQKLLDYLVKNQSTHINEYKEAMTSYRKEMVKILTEMLSDAREGKDVNHTVNLVRPVSYSSFYEEAIQMLTWETRDIVELDQHQFKQYVMDEWGWKNSFSALAATYKSL